MLLRSNFSLVFIIEKSPYLHKMHIGLNNTTWHSNNHDVKPSRRALAAYGRTSMLLPPCSCGKVGDASTCTDLEKPLRHTKLKMEMEYDRVYVFY